MSTTADTIPVTASKDAAAEHFQKTQHHHAFVVSLPKQEDSGPPQPANWVGLLTVWDVAFGMARDDRAWPWNAGAIDYFVSHSSPRIKKQIRQRNKNATAASSVPEPHSFLGIAGVAEVPSPVSPASMKKDVNSRKTSDVEPHSFLGIAGSTE